MNRTIEHTLETTAGAAAARTQLTDIEQQLQTLAENRKSAIHTIVTVDMGDSHSGPEDFEPKTSVTPQIDLGYLFQPFFEMGHYRLFVEINEAQDEITIQTGSTYCVGGWYDQRVVCSIQ